MAEFATQDVGPILADDLMQDRTRQFVEFLDDEVGDSHLSHAATVCLSGQWLMDRHKQITTTVNRFEGCWTTSRSDWWSTWMICETTIAPMPMGEPTLLLDLHMDQAE